jgi:hypothetical protein
VSQGGDCSPLVGEDLGDLDSLNRTGLISASLSSQPAELQLLDYHIVCVAQGTERDTWRMVSGVATFMLTGGINSTVQFHFQCENDGSAWSNTVINSTEYVLTTSSPNATFDTPNRTDCALCVSPEQESDADNDQHCVCKFAIIVYYLAIHVLKYGSPRAIASDCNASDAQLDHG